MGDTIEMDYDFLQSFFSEHVVPDEDENLGDLEIFLDFDFGTIE